MIPFPELIGYGYINNTKKRGNDWFADICLVVGKEYRDMSLLMIQAAENMAIACVDIEKAPMHETDWASKKLFKLTIELRPGYDGVLKRVMKVSESEYSSWKKKTGKKV